MRVCHSYWLKSKQFDGVMATPATPAHKNQLKKLPQIFLSIHFVITANLTKKQNFVEKKSFLQKVAKNCKTSFKGLAWAPAAALSGDEPENRCYSSVETSKLCSHFKKFLPVLAIQYLKLRSGTMRLHHSNIFVLFLSNSKEERESSRLFIVDTWHNTF